MANLAGSLKLPKGLGHLIGIHKRIRPVKQQHIQIIGGQTAQNAFRTVDDMGSGEVISGRRAIIFGKPDAAFGLQKDILPQSRLTGKLVEKFNETHPDIVVETQSLPANADVVHDDFVTKLASGDTSVDVMAIDIIWPAEFGAANWLEPLDSYFSQQELDALLPGAVKGGTYKDQLISVPWFSHGGVLYYRKDILEKAGKQPPKTFDELLALSKELGGKDGTEFGFVFQANQYEGLVTNWLEYIWGNGGNVLDQDGKVVVNSANNIEATQYMMDLVSTVAPKGVTTYTEPESMQVFLEGKSVFHRGWPNVWVESQKEGSKVKDKVGIIPMPVGPQGTEPAATLGGLNLAINKNIDAKQKEAAVEFLRFMISSEAQKIGVVDGGMPPVLKASYEDPEILAAAPYMKEIYNALITAKPRPVSPNYPKISDAIQRNIHKALTGVSTAEDALNTLQKEIEEIEK